MPKWGLDMPQQESAPWGIPADWLRPAKTITDPVHGDIHLNVLERAFLDTAPLQRLRRVRQLGATHLVYPGASHSRLSHSLGAVRAAQNLLDAVIDNRSGPHHRKRDLFHEWSDDEYPRKLAEVTVLARLGALLHDMCHVPYGHSVEDDLKILKAHDRNQARFNALWDQLPTHLVEMLDDADPCFVSDLHGLIMSKDKDGKNLAPADFRYPFVADIVGNTICADLIDYLERDHLYSGLPASFGHRFADDFFVSPADDTYYPQRMVVGISRGGHERADVVTELLKYLRYRYELSERVLTHHAKLAADAMIGKILELWHDELWVRRATKAHPDIEIAYEDASAARAAVRNTAGEDAVRKIDRAVRRKMETRFIQHGDDGLLEWLLDWSAGPTSGRRHAIHRLTYAVQNRELFKPIGRADDNHARGLREEIFQKFGKDPAERRTLEQAAARFAGFNEKWQLVVWLPEPKMRLKVAKVLVERNGQISPLDTLGYERAREIYESHRNLWAISVFAHESPDSTDRVRAALAFLSRHLGVTFRTRGGAVVPSIADLAIESVAKQYDLQLSQRQELREAAIDAEDQGALGLAAHGGEATFADWRTGIEQIALENNLVAETTSPPTI